jgi:hypothetical protein
MSSVLGINLMRWNNRFAKWKREGIEHFRQHTAMFKRPLNTIYDDIVRAIFAQETFLSNCYSRRKALRDRA